MTACVDECPLEATQQDDRSCGCIADDELICRASYDPMHYRRSKVQNSFIRASDLFAGQLSVWRASEQSGLAADELPPIIGAPEEQVLARLHGVSAKALRDERSPEGDGRMFCVVDETDTDDQGGSHPAHAHIRLCDLQRAQIVGSEDKRFRYARERLIFLFKQLDAAVWP